ncbi:hypothetical protein DFJ63DRAFT_315249 [Scheffersomyces coipomensis]|uniref:uncharacterized protein n=1 Tax=Scheffersomyces coipomensis TaxID=1788519 RepID=UPI00315D59F7
MIPPPQESPSLQSLLSSSDDSNRTSIKQEESQRQQQPQNNENNENQIITSAESSKNETAKNVSTMRPIIETLAISLPQPQAQSTGSQSPYQNRPFIPSYTNGINHSTSNNTLGPTNVPTTNVAYSNYYPQAPHPSNLQEDLINNQLYFKPNSASTISKTITSTSDLKNANFKKFNINKKSSTTSTSNSRPYACEFEGCTWSFSRRSDLRRHSKSHSEPMFHCPYYELDQTCHRNGGSFNRLDVLKRHLKLVHYIKDVRKDDNQLPFSNNIKEDPGWCKGCQRMFPNSKAFIEHCIGCSKYLANKKNSELNSAVVNTKDNNDTKTNDTSRSTISTASSDVTITTNNTSQSEEQTTVQKQDTSTYVTIQNTSEFNNPQFTN